MLILASWSVATAVFAAEPVKDKSVQLFTTDGAPMNWLVRRWDDVSKVPEKPSAWIFEKGVLHGSRERGSWLMSEQEYSDFLLDFEFKLGPLGNSGLALRAPLKGDPAFDGMELQMVDKRYNPKANDAELTGGLYRAVAPLKQVYKPTEWNRYEITLKGNSLRVLLNGEVIHDRDLSKETRVIKRHDGSDVPPIKDRPRRGHIGFQELSRGDVGVQIRNVRIIDLGKAQPN